MQLFQKQIHFFQSKQQLLRTLVQLIILTLLLAGLYGKIRSGFIILLPLAFLAGNFFCGWICPFGSIQELASKFGSIFLKNKLKMPPSLQYYLQYSRYIIAILVLFLASQSIADLSFLNAYKTFMHSTAGKTAQFLALAILSSFIFVAIFFERPFCNYFCPEGIRYGLLSLARIFTIKRNKTTCINCKKCDQACPMNIVVSANKQIRHAHCINCFKCISACPLHQTLTYGKVTLSKKTNPK